MATPEALRADMVRRLLATRAIRSDAVAAALRAVPRHEFLPGVPFDEAYADEAVVTKVVARQAISSVSRPTVIAEMLEQLAPPQAGRILEIGTGSGYNAALLASLVGDWGRVTTIEIDAGLADCARATLARLGFANVTVVRGDGARGWAAGAPYDGIIVTAGAREVFPAWRDQLAQGGRLVVPLSLNAAGCCVAFEHQHGLLVAFSVIPTGFLPLRAEEGHPR